MKRSIQQTLGLLGILSLLSYATAVAFAPLAYPGYDWLSQAVSDFLPTQRRPERCGTSSPPCICPAASSAAHCARWRSAAL